MGSIGAQLTIIIIEGSSECICAYCVFWFDYYLVIWFGKSFNKHSSIIINIILVMKIEQLEEKIQTNIHIF